MPWRDLVRLMFLILATLNPDALKIHPVAYSACCRVISIFMCPDKIEALGYKISPQVGKKTR